MHKWFACRRQMLRRLAGLALMLSLGACSIDVSGVTPAPTGALPHTTSLAAPTLSATTTSALTPAITLATNAPGSTDASASTPTPSATASARPARPQPTPFSVPVTWADQHLAGKLVFTAGTEGVLQFDLAAGTVTSLFAPPDPVNAWVVAAAVAVNAPQSVIAYAPPPAGGALQFGYTWLYSLPQPGGAPQPLFTQVQDKESYFDPIWSPDGHWLYYVHLTTPVTQTDTSRFDIERVSLPGGQPAVAVQDAFWPRVAPDGQRLAFVHYNYQDGSQALYVGNLDGTQERHIVLPAAFQSTDSPMFTPDSKNLIFSGITNGTLSPALSWLERLLGVQTAYADGSPADWWMVPVAGGKPRQLTHVNDSSMYGAFSPDGQHIAYISASGLYVMKPDGSGIIQLLGTAALPGSVGTATVAWVP